MSTRTSRNSKRTVAALAAFGVLASTFAIGSPASAELFDPDLGELPGPGGIRLEPTYTGAFTDFFGTPTSPVAQDQPAPAIPAGATSDAAAMQVLVHNQWNAGDRVLIQLFDSDEDNCASAAEALGFATAAADLDVAVSGPFVYDPAAGSPWQETNNPNPDVVGLADDPVAATGLAPVFTPTLGASSGCAAQGINDVLILSFANTSTTPLTIDDPNSADPAVTIPNPALTNAFVVTIDDYQLRVGAEVAGGPVIALPVAQNRSDVAANLFVPTVNMFSGNSTNFGPFAPEVLPADVVLAINEYTNPAFIVPVTLTSNAPGALVDDGFFQDLGDITLSGTQVGALTPSTPVGLDPDTYKLCIGPGIGSINADLLEVTTNAAGTTIGDVTTDSAGCIYVEVLTVTGVASFTIDNIFGRVNSAGSKFVSLQDAPNAFLEAHLTPNDIGPFTDVNLGTLVPFFEVPHGSASALVDRIGGNDRFETASKIAYSVVNKDGEGGDCADFAVLVNGNSFPDSLTASYLAGALTLSSNNDEGTVPILTTSGTSLHAAAELAIRELGVRTVYIVGGPNAVSADVAAAVDALPRAECGGNISDTTQSVEVDRIDGVDRYATNRIVVQRAQSILDGDTVNYNSRIRYQANAGEASQRTALMASGANFADAMSAGPISFGNSQYGFPLVLTTPTTLSPDAALTLANLDIDQVVIVGGPAAVSAGVVASLEALGIDVIRLAGADRYETAVQVLLWAATEQFPNDDPGLDGGEGYNLGLEWNLFGNIVLARGDDFADALAVAPYVATNPQDLLVLTTPTSLHPAAGAFISTIASIRDSVGFTTGPRVIAIGLGAAIAGNVLDQANALANP